MKAVVLVVFALMTAGAGYVTWYGIGGTDTDVARSIRSGSAGHAGGVRIK